MTATARRIERLRARLAEIGRHTARSGGEIDASLVDEVAQCADELHALERADEAAFWEQIHAQSQRPAMVETLVEGEAAPDTRRPVPGHLAWFAGVPPETSPDELAGALTRKLLGMLREAIARAPSGFVERFDEDVEAWRRTITILRADLPEDEGALLDDSTSILEQECAGAIAARRQQHEERMAYWAASLERLAKERAQAVPPVETMAWRVGRIQVSNRFDAEGRWFEALALRLERGTRLSADDDAIGWLAGYQFRAALDAADSESIVDAIEAAFPDWARERRIDDLSDRITSIHPMIKAARTRGDGRRLHALIAEREGARTQREALYRERDGLPPSPPKTQRADLSKLSIKERKEHKREQARVRKRRERENAKADGRDLPTVVRDRFGGACVLCGNNEDLDLHHRHDAACPVCFPDSDLVRGLDTATKQRTRDPVAAYQIADGLDDSELRHHFRLACGGCHQDIHAGLARLHVEDDDDDDLENEMTHVTPVQISMRGL